MTNLKKQDRRPSDLTSLSSSDDSNQQAKVVQVTRKRARPDTDRSPTASPLSTYQGYRADRSDRHRVKQEPADGDWSVSHSPFFLYTSLETSQSM